jgi:hypothetical protein
MILSGVAGWDCASFQPRPTSHVSATRSLFKLMKALYSFGSHHPDPPSASQIGLVLRLLASDSVTCITICAESALQNGLSWSDSEEPCRPTTGYRVSSLRLQPSRLTAISCWSSTTARPVLPAASLRDFLSGAYTAFVWRIADFPRICNSPHTRHARSEECSRQVATRALAVSRDQP